MSGSSGNKFHKAVNELQQNLATRSANFKQALLSLNRLERESERQRMPSRGISVDTQTFNTYIDATNNVFAIVFAIMISTVFAILHLFKRYLAEFKAEVQAQKMRRSLVSKFRFVLERRKAQEHIAKILANKNRVMLGAQTQFASLLALKNGTQVKLSNLQQEFQQLHIQYNKLLKSHYVVPKMSTLIRRIDTIRHDFEKAIVLLSKRQIARTRLIIYNALVKASPYAMVLSKIVLVVIISIGLRLLYKKYLSSRKTKISTNRKRNQLPTTSPKRLPNASTRVLRSQTKWQK